MTLAIGDKVRLKKYAASSNWAEFPSDNQSGEYFVRELLLDHVRVSAMIHGYGFWVTRDSVEKVEDKPVNSVGDSLYTVSGKVVSVVEKSKHSACVSLRCGEWIEGECGMRGLADRSVEINVSPLQARTMKFGDEYEVSIRRKT